MGVMGHKTGIFKDPFRTAQGSNFMVSEPASPQRESRGTAPGGGSGGEDP